MNLKETLEKIKTLFTEEVKFLDIKAQDGTLLRTAKAFDKGEAVEVIAEDGSTSPAPDNTYVLEDGSSLVISGAIITEVIPASEDAPVEEETELAEAPATEPIAETPADEANEDNALAELTSRVEQLEEAIAMLIDKLTANNQEMKKTKQALSKVKEENETLKKAPAAKPVSTKKFEKEGSPNKTITMLERVIQARK